MKNQHLNARDELFFTISKEIDQSISALILELNQLVLKLTRGRFSSVQETVACADFSLLQEPLVVEHAVSQPKNYSGFLQIPAYYSKGSNRIIYS